MDDKPLVSVIIIFFNAKKFLREAVESVFAQTYNRWELLLVDDGSTDSSTKIALRYVKRNPRKARYLEHAGHTNRGMSASRNLGVRNSRGAYIAFVDADDIWLPKKLERQVPILNSHPEAALVFEATLFWHSWKRGGGGDLKQDIGVPPNTLIKPPKLLNMFLRNEDAVPSTCSFLIRRNTFDRHGGFEEAFRGMYEDKAFLTKVCLDVPVFVGDGCLSKNRLHPESCCSIAIRTGQYHPARLRFLTWVTEYLSERRVKDPQVWKILDMELWPYRHQIMLRALGELSHVFGCMLPQGMKKALVFTVFPKLHMPASVAVYKV